MGELRKDYILDRFVIIATERARRPEQFKTEVKPSSSNTSDCFFCKGNEHKTPAEIGRISYNNSVGNGWMMRWFDNKFAAVYPRGNYRIVTDNNFYTFSDAYGYHEVIVETDDHNKQIWDFSLDYLSSLFKVYSRRIADIQKRPGIKYVSVFKNHKKDAGASVEHSHSQVIGYNLYPTSVYHKAEASQRFSQCPYCDIIQSEKSSFRSCFENESFVAFTPYASMYPFEIVVFAKRHILSFDEFIDVTFDDLAEIMQKIFLKLKELNAPFNYYIHYGTNHNDLHFQIEIVPRLSNWAGFEYATDTIINTVTPEDAAKFYRGS